MNILVISNNSLNYSNSNGRTILNMLNNFSDNEIFSIYLTGDAPDNNRTKSFRVNERLLANPFHFKNIISQPGPSFKNNSRVSKKTKNVIKTPFKCLVRSFLWKNKKIYKQIFKLTSNFHVDAILIQTGDCDFLINLAVKLAKGLNVKLLSFCSEDYIFKDWNYLTKKRKGFFYNKFFKNLNKSYDLLYKNADEHIYLTDNLQKLYQVRFPKHNSHVIYNSSNLTPVNNVNIKGDIVYSGNIGVGRLQELIKISEIIYKISNKKVLVVSGTNDFKLCEEARRSTYLNFLGCVSYERNLEIISNASLIIHVESFDDFYKKDTANAFSTKIADSLSLAIPFFVYAPKSSFVNCYFKKNDACFLASNTEEAVTIFKKILFEKKALLSKRKLAILLSKKNHNITTNSRIFYEILKGLLYGS